MIKYLPGLTDVVLEEIPGRVTLAVEITCCQGRCLSCHSPFLREDTGEALTVEVASGLIEDNFGINCFLLLGEGNDRTALLELARELKRRYPALELAIYSGRKEVEQEFYELFDYVKVGPYIPECGPLNKTTTNQRLYYHGKDITSAFWHKKQD